MKIRGVTFSVTKLLREQIITGELSSGEKLNENEIAARMEISRPPLREAFRKLEYEKLVVSIPRKGTYVSSISIADCEELFHVRVLIECAAVDCLKMKKIRQLPIVEETMSIAEKLLAPSPTHGETEHLLYYYKPMAAFHEKLVESSENRWLIHSYNSLGGSLARYQIMYLNIPGSLPVSLGEHASVLQMIRDGNFAAAKKHLKAHIEGTAKRLKEKMTRAEMVE